MREKHSGRNPLAQPRPLKPEERAALLAILNCADFEGRDALVEQVDAARVVGCCDCGCATVDLAVSASAPSAHSPSPIPNEAAVLGDDGAPVGGVLIFVSDDGYLSMLEVYAYDVDPIAPFPPLERLKLEQVGSGG